MQKKSLISPVARAMINTETPLGEPFKIERGEVLKFYNAIGLNLSSLEIKKGKKKNGNITVSAIYLDCNMPSGDEREITDKIPLPVQNRMRVKDEIELIHPIYIGDTIRAKTKIVNIFEKEGKTGRLAFIVTETEYINQNDVVVRKHRITSIRR